MNKYRPENRNLFSETYLDSQWLEDFGPLEAESRVAFQRLSALRRQARPERFDEGREQQLREEYLDKVLDFLGWFRSGEGKIPGDGKPDYTLFDENSDKDAALSHLGEIGFFQDAVCLCEAKSWATNLHRKLAEDRSPRGQIYGYLEDTHVPWGFITNGKEWMLVWREYSRAQQRDYTVDLDALLLKDDWSSDFLYFYGFFSRAGVSKALLVRAVERSRLSGEAVGRNLKTNVFEALLTLGRSVSAGRTAEAVTEAELGELKSNCLIFLYRILFVNYAESRKLLPMKDSDLYRRSYSLLRVKEAIQQAAPRMRPEEYLTISDESTDYFRNIRKLFKAIDEGLPKAQIPPYNGGLFRSADHPFLDSVEIDDRTVARVVDLLSRTEGDPERFVDYSYLGVRELGSIYEGLLEYQFKRANQKLVATPGETKGTEVWVPQGAAGTATGATGRAEVEPGQLYLATAKGERKSSGSFYTPDDVVRYIVRESLGAAVDRRVGEARSRGDDPQLAILNFKVLDPAMGSGHFLVAATEFLAEKLLNAGEDRATDPAASSGGDELEAWAKRQIASHCIYGVDLNPMAVELAKVSLWLTTFSRGHPLTFLDHRLKCGNSLLGSRLEELAVFPRVSSRPEAGGPRSRSRVRPFDITGLEEEFRRPIEAVESIDETTVEDVERKKALYVAFLQGPRYGRVVTLANSHAALCYSPAKETPLATKSWDGFVHAAVDSDGEGWSRLASSDLLAAGSAFATSRRPFHWDLEFPEVFARPSPGFDAVIGNPPYVRIYRGQLSEEDVAFFQRRFLSAHMKFDLYVLFLELGVGLLRRGGRLGFIVPDKFTTSPYGEPIRHLILRNRLVSMLDLRRENVFPTVRVAPLIVLAEGGSPHDNETSILAPTHGLAHLDSLRVVARVPQSVFSRFPQSQIRIDAAFDELELLAKLSRNSFPLSRAFYVNWGLRTGTAEKTDRMITPVSTGSNPKPLLRGEDVREAYLLERPPRFIDYDVHELYNPMFPELFENPKVVFRKISGPEGFRAVLDERGAYCFSTLICATSLTSLKRVDRVGVEPAGREARRVHDPAFVLALSNSKLVAWWYRQSHSDKLGVNPAHVQAIPVPKVLLDAPATKAPADLSNLDVDTLVHADPGHLESIVTQGGRELQSKGDSVVAQAEGFVGWLKRELGDQVGRLFENKIVERLEETDEAALVHLLEDLHRKQSLRSDPRSRPVQEAVLAEYRTTRAKIARLRVEMHAVQSDVETCIHLLFGLTRQESQRVLRPAPPVGSAS